MERRLVLLLILLLSLSACEAPPKGPETSVSESELQEIAGRIELARGPVRGWEDLLLEIYPEPVWLTGLDIVVVDESGQEASSKLADLVTLGWTYPEEHAKRFHPQKQASGILFRLAATQGSVKLPQGYGIPMWSNEPLDLRVRWSNTDLYQKNTKVRVKATAHFVRQRVLKSPLKAVLPADLFVGAPIRGLGQYKVSEPWELQSQVPRGVVEGLDPFGDPQNRHYTEEWLISAEAPEVSFLLNGLLPDLPGQDCVFQTAYTFPGTTSVKLEYGETELPIPGPDGAQFKVIEGRDLVLSLGQDVKKAGRRNSARLLLYFLDTDFQEFPEMLQ